MIRCPECGNESETFYVNAPAVIETLQMVGAEVTIAEVREDLKHDASGLAYLPLFRLDDQLETLDGCLDHHTLEIGNEEQAEFFCNDCNAILDRATVWSAVERERKVEA